MFLVRNFLALEIKHDFICINIELIYLEKKIVIYLLRKLLFSLNCAPLSLWLNDVTGKEVDKAVE